jgi:DNA polymerase-3 subunit delta'
MSGERFVTRGHPAAVAAMDRWIRQQRAPHALLISGPDGCGKTTLALDLAAGLLCLDPDPAARPCRTCAACHKVAHGNHPDVHRLAPQGAGEQIRLGQVQDLIGDLALKPMEGRVRFCLIEDAQRLNPDAQNALLKALEEPVGESCLVLAADDTAPILPTVLSRVARVRLGPVPVDDVAGWLMERGIPAAAARTAARSSDGRPGRALALARDPEIGLARDRLARQLLDLAEADRRTRLAAAADLMATGLSLDAQPEPATDEPSPESDAAAVAIDATASGARARPSRVRRTPSASTRLQPADRRRAVARVLETWRDVGRDLAVFASGGRAEIRRIELLEELDRLAPRLDRHALARFLDGLDGLSAAIESYASPELVLDALLLRWPQPRPVAAARVPIPA